MTHTPAHTGPESFPHPDALHQQQGPATWADVIEAMRPALPQSMEMLRQVHHVLQMPRFNVSRIRQADQYVRRLAMEEGIPMAELNRIAPKNPRELARFVQQAMEQLSQPGWEMVVDPMAVQFINPATGAVESLMYDPARNVYVPVPIAPVPVPDIAPAPSITVPLSPTPAPVTPPAPSRVDPTPAAAPPMAAPALTSTSAPRTSAETPLVSISVPTEEKYPQFFASLTPEETVIRKEHFTKFQKWITQYTSILQSDTFFQEKIKQVQQHATSFPLMQEMIGVEDTSENREKGAFFVESIVLMTMSEIAKLEGDDLKIGMAFARDVKKLVQNLITPDKETILQQVKVLLQRYEGTKVGTFFGDLTEEVSRYAGMSATAPTPTPVPSLAPTPTPVAPASAAPTAAPSAAPVETSEARDERLREFFVKGVEVKNGIVTLQGGTDVQMAHIDGPLMIPEGVVEMHGKLAIDNHVGVIFPSTLKKIDGDVQFGYSPMASGVKFHSDGVEISGNVRIHNEWNGPYNNLQIIHKYLGPMQNANVQVRGTIYAILSTYAGITADFLQQKYPEYTFDEYENYPIPS